LVSDADKQTPDYDLPPPTKDGAITRGEENDRQQRPPGHQEDEDERFWKIAGWAPRFGYAIPPDVDFSKNLADQQTWLEERLHDHLFGGTFDTPDISASLC
jgi:hypothetical protein